MNREGYFRSDFYILGVIFYRILVGRCSFDIPSAIKNVQSYVLQEPTFSHKIDPNEPLPLSDMILKLMENNVDLRCQSAKGTMFDIHLIISEHKTGEKNFDDSIET